MRGLLVLLLVLAVVNGGCVDKDGGDRGTGPYFCSIDSDCVVKDVHNCCGYYPRCVNKDYVPDIEAVKRECQNKGGASVCGYPDITHCRCIENICRSMQGDSIV